MKYKQSISATPAREALERMSRRRFGLSRGEFDELAALAAAELERGERLEAALRFYADPSTYEESGTGSQDSFGNYQTTSIPIFDDHGDAARAALSAQTAQETMPCPKCRGVGDVHGERCWRCHGSGDVPAAQEDGA
jgi:hypothetical protein